MNQKDYLIHYGVLGMKWGVRKDRYKGLSKSDYKQRKKINKKMKKEEGRYYRTNDSRIKNRAKVNSEVSKALSSDKELAKLWGKVHESYRLGDADRSRKLKEAYNKRVDEIQKPYKKKYVDALIKDYGLVNVSDINKQYISDVLNDKIEPDYVNKKK